MANDEASECVQDQGEGGRISPVRGGGISVVISGISRRTDASHSSNYWTEDIHGGLSPATRSLMRAGRPGGRRKVLKPGRPAFLWLPSSPDLRGEFRLSLRQRADHRRRQRC